MRLFRRQAPPSDFWAWWPSARDRIAHAIEHDVMSGSLIDEIARNVRAIHPNAAFEMASGRSARHAFCVSPQGQPEVRIAALRWLEAAPEADESWEFHASRQPGRKSGALEINGLVVDLVEMRAVTTWDSTAGLLGVRLGHPMFSQMPEGTRVQVAFLFLDDLIGEDDVERWIGGVDVAEHPIGGRSPAELLAELDRRRAEAVDGWVVGHMMGRHGPTFVTAHVALKRIDHPFADQHVAIAVSLPDGGLPDDALATELNAEEDELTERLGATAVLAGRTTWPGTRTLHLVTADAEAARQAIDAWARGLPARRIRVTVERDVNWTFRKSELGLG